MAMRYIAFIKPARDYGEPPRAMQEAMGKYVEQQLRSSRLVETGGMAAASEIVRVQLSGGDVNVVDGPFSEAKEVTGGYAILEYGSRDEAIEGVREFMELHHTYWPEFEAECELRELYKM